MAERNSWAVGSDTDRRITVEDARIAIGAVWTPDGGNIDARGGFRPGAGDPGKVTASTTADTDVHVAPFQYVLPASRGTGPYITSLDASKTIDILTEHPADASNPRRDLIVAQQHDAYYDDDDSRFVVRHIVGDPSSTPTDPEVDGSPDYVELARIRVDANTTAITDSDIDDLRPLPLYTVAVGGVLPIDSARQRDEIEDPYDGMTIYRTDWGWAEIWDGAAWRVRGTATASSLSSLQTGITDPYQGQLAVVRGWNMLYLYDGNSWVPTAATAMSTVLRQTIQQDLPNGADTAIRFDTAEFHDLGSWSGDTFTFDMPGRYELFGICSFFVNTSRGRRVQLTANGSTIPSSLVYSPPTTGHTTEVATPVVEYQASNGDTLQLVAYQDSGSKGNTGASSDIQPMLRIKYIGPA